MLELSYGILSDDTFIRFLQMIDSDLLSEYLFLHGSVILDSYKDKLISIAG